MSIVNLGDKRVLGAAFVLCFGNIDFEGAEYVEDGVVRPGLPELLTPGS